MLSLIPAKAWLLAGVLALAAFGYWRVTDAAYQRGRASAITEIEKGARDAEKRAEDELRRLDRGDDGRMRRFDRND